MSSVYKATDRVLERTVAVKILAEHLSDDDKFVARFRREALAVAKLIHPNIVQVYDTGVDDGRHYIVMEYVEGRSGAQLLQTRGAAGARDRGRDRDPVLRRARLRPPPGDHPPRRQAREPDGDRRRPRARGNSGSTAHDPPTGEMTVKLTDFGIARAAEQSRLTQVGSVVGTAAYLAPEQARGEEATPGLRRLRARRGHLPAPDRAPPLGGRDAGRARDPARERAPAPARAPTTPTVPETLSTAVLRSLDGDPAAPLLDRPRARGRAPRRRAGTEPPAPDGARDAGDADASGRADRGHPPPAGRADAPRPAAARAPRGHAPPPAPPAGKPKRSAAKRIRAAIGVLLVIAILAGVVAGIVLLTTNAGQNTDLIKHTIPDQIDQLKEFINDHTQ